MMSTGRVGAASAAATLVAFAYFFAGLVCVEVQAQGQSGRRMDELLFAPRHER
jgi:hypothetical protein